MAIAPSTDAEPQRRFEPRTWGQKRALLSEAPEVLFSGPYGTMKTRGVIEKGDLLCRCFPKLKAVLARKKRVDLGVSAIPILLDQVISPAEKQRGWRTSQDGGSTLHYDNGSTILCVGLDNPGKLRSGEFDLAIINQAEELESEEFDAIGGRLRGMAGPFRQLIADCNPREPAHFLYKRFKIREGSRRHYSTEDVKLHGGAIYPKGSIIMETIIAQPGDGHEFLPADYQARLRRYTGRYYDRYVLGLWESFEGLIYPNFDPWFHVIPKPEEWVEEWGGYPPPSWPRYRGIDFGFRNPFVCVWVTRSPLGTLYAYREIYMTQRTVRAHAKQMRELEAAELETLRECAMRKNLKMPERLNIGMSVADHDAEDIATLDECGIAADPAVKEVAPGIETVYSLFEQHIDPLTDKREAGVYLIADSLVEKDQSLEDAGKPTCGAEELQGYRNRPEPSIRRGVNPAEEPMKVSDHYCDAFRYVLHTLHVSGEVRVISLASPREEDD